jgi:hypothetical protein
MTFAINAELEPLYTRFSTSAVLLVDIGITHQLEYS